MSFLIFKNGGKGSHYGPILANLRTFGDGGPLGITLLQGIRDKYNGTVNSYIDGIYANGTEESYGNPSDHYNNVDEKKLKQMTPNARGHYDDSVKLPNHPSSPTRGTFNGKYFDFTDKGFEDPNYTMFGLQDNGDGNVIMRYNGAIVIPELTVTPNGNYYNDTYNNIKIHQGHKHDLGGSLDNTLPEVVVIGKRTPKKANGGRVLMGQQGTNPAWSALYQSLSKRKGKLPEQAVRDTVNYAITRGRELGVPFEFTRSVLSNAMQESGMIYNARRGSHYGLIQATWIPRNYNAKQQIDMIYDMAQHPAKYKDNRVLGYEANLLNKSYRNPSTRNFFNWTERAGVRAWNAAPRNVYDSAFDSYYKSVYTNPEPTVDYVSQPTVDYVSPHIVELPDALRVAKPVILPSLKLGGLLRFISFKKVEN